MPIFLERHDYFKVTASDFARIHLEDLKLQQEFGCWVLAYWCDVKRKITFCLIDAPNLESVRKMHCHLDNSSPGQIIQVEEDLIDLFLRNMENPAPSVKKAAFGHVFQKHEFYAVMALKFHCSNPFPLQNGAAEKSFLGNFKDSVIKIVGKKKGRRITAACDSYIYYFDSLSLCVRSALQIIEELKVQEKSLDEKTMHVTIGIDGRRQKGQRCEFFEDALTLAGRLCDIAGRNQVIISARLMEQIQREEGSSEKDCRLNSLSTSDEQFLTSLMEVIESSYKEDLKIGDFCRKMGKSRSQLYRKIIEVTKLPPIELINELRLNRSLELMKMQNGSNISQIAFEAGFNSLSYFSRKFKKRFGFLPSAFLNRTT